MEQLPVGVIGVGHLGSLHVKMLAGNPSVDLIGVVDSDPVRSGSVGKEFGVKVFTSPEELLPHVKAVDRKSTRLNSSHIQKSRMPSSA